MYLVLALKGFHTVTEHPPECIKGVSILDTVVTITKVILMKQEIVFKKDKATLHVISKNVKT